LEIIETRVSRSESLWSVHYLERSALQLGAVLSLTPAGQDCLLDACIAFYPQHFRHCESLRSVERLLRHTSHLDFNQGEPKDALQFWPQLRKEARPAFEQLVVYEAHLRPVVVSQHHSGSQPWWTAAARAAGSLWRTRRPAA